MYNCISNSCELLDGEGTLFGIAIVHNSVSYDLTQVDGGGVTAEHLSHLLERIAEQDMHAGEPITIKGAALFDPDSHKWIEADNSEDLVERIREYFTPGKWFFDVFIYFAPHPVEAGPARWWTRQVEAG